MKEIISILIGVAIFIGGFFLSADLISWIASSFETSDGRLVCKIVLWVIGFPLIFWLSLAFGGIFGGLVYHILPKKKR